MQNDEATVEYYNYMENMEAGWRFLLDTFGKRPHVGWQLDPFGYSAVTPTLLEAYGFDTLFMTRVGSQVKENLRENGHLRFIWRGHNSQHGIFVTVNQGDLYTVTHKMKYDVRTPEETRNTSARCTLEDLEKEKLSCLDIFVEDIVSNHLQTTDLHSTDDTTRFHIPALFGDDFAYTNATHNFAYINKLAKLLKAHSAERFGV